MSLGPNKQSARKGYNWWESQNESPIFYLILFLREFKKNNFLIIIAFDLFNYWYYKAIASYCFHFSFGLNKLLQG